MTSRLPRRDRALIVDAAVEPPTKLAKRFEAYRPAVSLAVGNQQVAGSFL